MSSVTDKPPCAICKTPAVTRCSRCKVVHYCSEGCQRKDWSSHRIACTPSAASPKSATQTSTASASSSSKQPALPDPGKVLNVHPVDNKKNAGPSPLRKATPLATCTSLKFHYQPSEDGVDENLVIFFHGLGDKIEPNFVKLAQSLQLPQTATCCIQAPTPVPYLEEEGWQWFPSFNNLTGELLGPESPERMIQVKQLVRPALVKFLKHCVDHCGFSSRKISLFGFSQGAQIALDVAAFGGVDLRAVISVAGYFMEESQNETPATTLNTNVLIVQGDKDDLRPVKEAKDKFKYIQRIFGKANAEQIIVEGMGHSMPSNEPGWRALMQFFAKILDSRSTGLENMTDVFEESDIMMIKEPMDTDAGVIPKFESTLVIAFPDVLLAGPKILLSSASATSHGSFISAWSRYCSQPSKGKATVSKRSKSASENSIYYSTAVLDDQQNLGLLSIVVAPPTTEQATYLCEAIVNQIHASSTQRVILVAASNFAVKEQATHVVQINHDTKLDLPIMPKGVALGDHILNTFLALLTYTDIPTVALVHPAKKGTGLRETQAILENLTSSLALAIGGKGSSVFSAEAAFQYNISRTEDEENVESMISTQLQQQHAYYPQLSFEDQQQLQQQRLILQKQQQRAQLHLQNLQIRQKKKLLEDQQQRLQSLQSVTPQNPALLPSSPSENFISTPHYNSLLSAPPESLAYPTYVLNTATGNINNDHHNHYNSNNATTTASPNLISVSGSTSSAMDILTMAPFPIHQHQTSLTTNSLLQQQTIHQIGQQRQQPSQQHQNQQQQPVQGQSSPFYHPLKFETNQSNQPLLNISTNTTGSGDVSVSSLNNENGLQGYGTDGWTASANALLDENMTLLGHSAQGDVLRRLSHSSGISDMSVATSGSVNEDQLEELSSTGAIISAPLVDEVRTGQQFLIKLQLTKPGATPSSSTKFPAIRVERREAINTAGEPRSEAEPLTLQIIVHLAKSGQIRKGACAKCCHKYGPSSPILVLLDPLSPSATDPTSYAHVDTTSGSVTLLAKVICSSTDHGERGNKDQYVFEFRLKRTNVAKKMSMSPISPDAVEDDGEVIVSCLTAPIMCSGHHKAKRAYPSQRPSKVTEDGPVPKTKVIKRRKNIPNAAGSTPGSKYSPEQTDEYLRSGSISSSSNYPSPMSFMQDNFANAAAVSNFGDDQSSDFDFRGSTLFPGQPMLNASESESSSSGVMGSPQFQPPRICEVRPDHGPIRKTTDVILRGLFFREGMVPYFGCFPAQDIVVETSSLIICKAPESPLPGTVPIAIYDNAGTNFADLGQFTYTDDSETELLIMQLQLRLAHRALEYLHAQATGQRGNANDILREIPGLSSSPRSNGPSSGGAYMMADSAAFDEESDSNMLTLEQVEESILKTLDQLPASMDISIQLGDQGNLLHLSILQGLDKLTMRLIEDGCELEALDQWAMTPLMYAVIKGNESIVRALVLAGASSSGAKTPREFYACLPRPVAPTRAVVGYLSVSCTRHSTTTLTPVLHRTGGQPYMIEIEIEIEIENDETSISSDEEDDKHKPDNATPSIAEQPLPVVSEFVPETNAMPVDTGTFEQLAQRIRAVHINQDMLPLDQQELPPMHTVESDGSVKVNNTVLKGDQILQGKVSVNDTVTTDNEESGYHSGVYSEVQDRLSLLNKSNLPAEGVQMTVAFHRAASSVKAATSSSSPMPDNLFRTGDSFGIEIRLATIDEQNPLPNEFLGIRFPHEMVKRVNGRPASILNEMTYILKTSIELGQSNTIDLASSSSTAHDDHHRGDGIDLRGSCLACSKYLHEHKKISPSRISQEDPTVYPILQFNIPAAPMVIPPLGSAPPHDSAQRAGVMELRNGQVEVKARVNCSSLHHLIQREKAKRTAELRLRQQHQQGQEGEQLPSSSKGTKTPLDMRDLEDPGFVFTFELVHPTLHTVVARQQTGPILFQSYSRGRS
ncbi:hypothetical protein BGZ50_003872 [Haplosporangium sp. Z 11]|nr:hypothetical protein BGZ50_003872 [Haplosporangium sp. Z 11]